MKIKIKLVAPVPIPPEGRLLVEKMLASRRQAANAGTEIDFVIPQQGPRTLGTLSDLALSSEAVLPQVMKAPEEGYSAVIVDCTCDQLYPGITGELSIPLVPAFHSSLHLASMLAGRFSIITPTPGQGDIYTHLASRYGFEKNIVSVQEREVDYAGKNSMDDLIMSAFLEEGEIARHKGARCIILGCTALTIEKTLQEKLGVPVLAPGNVAVKVAEMLVHLGLRYN